MRRLGLDDVLALLGGVAVEYGVAQWSGAAAWVIGGLGLLGLALVPTWRARGR